MANASDYFRHLFAKRKRFHDHYDGRTSRITLDRVALEAFPCFLDYVYAYNGSPINLSSLLLAYLCPLYWLGNYFGVSQLIKDVQRSWEISPCQTYWIYYIADMQRLNVQPLSEFATSVCSERLIAMSNRCGFSMDPSFWLSVFENNFPMNTDESRAGSKIVVVNCSAEDVDCEPELFRQLTEERLLPAIDSGVATALMNLALDIVGVSEHDEDSDTGWISLKNRCIGALASEFCTPKIQEVTASLPPRYMTEFLQQAQRFVRKKSSRSRDS